jgi:lipopolysaccharide transport system permease protein
MPLSIVLSNIIKFAIQFALLISMIIYYALIGTYSIQIGINNLLIPVIILLMAGMGLGLGIIITSLTTKYRDLTVLVTFGVQLLMYITPVAYPLSYLEKSKYTDFIKWNPLSPMVEGFRYGVLGQGTVNWFYFLYSIGFTVIVLLLGILLFNKVERTFMDTV